MLSYNTPLNNTVSTGSINSTFIDILGSFSTSTGLVMDLYNSINPFWKNVSGLQNASRDLNLFLPAYDIAFSIAVSNASSVQSSTSGDINSIDNTLSNTSNSTEGYSIGLIVYYVGLLLVCLLAILSACCMNINRYKCCRYFLYLFCVLSFIGALFGFLLAIFYSVATPAAVWGCDYYNDTISSQGAFQSNPIDI